MFENEKHSYTERSGRKPDRYDWCWCPKCAEQAEQAETTIRPDILDMMAALVKDVQSACLNGPAIQLNVERWGEQEAALPDPRAVMSQQLFLVNDAGRPWRVVLVRKGDGYGLDNCLTHDEDDPLVEFWDLGVDPDKFPEGQFVSRYYRSTLLGESSYGVEPEDLERNGLCLQGGVEAWRVDGCAMVQVLRWLRTMEAPNAAGTDEEG